jgi:hypothetical protein
MPVNSKGPLSKFENYVSEIITGAKETVDNSVNALEGFSLMVSSYAADSKVAWPFITIPDFSARAETLAQISGAIRVFMSHIVEPEQKAAWEVYSQGEVANWYGNSIENESLESTLDQCLYHVVPICLLSCFMDASARTSRTRTSN